MAAAGDLLDALSLSPTPTPTPTLYLHPHPDPNPLTSSLDRMWDPIAYALGFLDCDHISARAMLTIFMLFAIRTEASVLRMLECAPRGRTLPLPLTRTRTLNPNPQPNLNPGPNPQPQPKPKPPTQTPTPTRTPTLIRGSPQTYLHDPIVNYLEERGAKLHLRTPIRDLVHEVDAQGKPTRVTGIVAGADKEVREFDAVVAGEPPHVV